MQRNPDESCLVRPFCRRKDGAQKRVQQHFFNHQNENNNGREHEFDCRAQSGNHHQADCTEPQGRIKGRRAVALHRGPLHDGYGHTDRPLYFLHRQFGLLSALLYAAVRHLGHHPLSEARTGPCPIEFHRYDGQQDVDHLRHLRAVVLHLCQFL